VDGLKWTPGEKHSWLKRAPNGANLGDPRAKSLAVRLFESIGQRIEILSLSFGGRRPSAQWPTNGRYPDVTAVVSKDKVSRSLIVSSSRFGVFVGQLPVLDVAAMRQEPT
jgi:hypothetical protein